MLVEPLFGVREEEMVIKAKQFFLSATVVFVISDWILPFVRLQAWVLG